jgi:hypothetical protein
MGRYYDDPYGPYAPTCRSVVGGPRSIPVAPIIEHPDDSQFDRSE